MRNKAAKTLTESGEAAGKGGLVEEVVSKDGKLITTWSSEHYDSAMQELIIKLFGEYVNVMNKINKIMIVVNEWDPIGFFPMAPKDEYINEIKKIIEYLNNNQDVSKGKLSQKVNEIFTQSFGSDVFSVC